MSKQVLVEEEGEEEVEEQDLLLSEGARYIDAVYFGTVPAGFRFVPQDVELVMYYLKRKVEKKPLPKSMIVDANIYRYHPQTLTEKYKYCGIDGQYWYFFTPRAKKYPNGSRPNRKAVGGYWKATGADKEVEDDKGETIGLKKSLVFYLGKAPRGEKTNWMMHEYKLKDSEDSAQTKISSMDKSKSKSKSKQPIHHPYMKLDDWVLCKIYNKSKGKVEDPEIDDSSAETSATTSMPPPPPSAMADYTSDYPLIAVSQNYEEELHHHHQAWQNHFHQTMDFPNPTFYENESFYNPCPINFSPSPPPFMDPPYYFNPCPQYINDPSLPPLMDFPHYYNSSINPSLPPFNHHQSHFMNPPQFNPHPGSTSYNPSPSQFNPNTNPHPSSSSSSGNPPPSPFDPQP